jgi:hypothetical protein
VINCLIGLDRFRGGVSTYAVTPPADIHGRIRTWANETED